MIANKLADKVEMLEEELRYLREEFIGDDPALNWKLPGFESMMLTNTERKYLRIMHKHFGNVVRRDFIYTALYGIRPESDQPDMTIVKVYICKIKRRLREAQAPYRIESSYGVGWRLLAL